LKEVKKIPAVEFEIPKKIFTKQELDSGAADSLVVKIVSFQ
jgi:U3 small nucleolar RNA-associated protein 19